MRDQIEFNKLIEHQDLDIGLKEELRIDKKLRFKIEKSSFSISSISKIGGFPDLSSEINYPVKDNCIYEFVCQINLGELPSNSILPNQGLLSFFVFDDNYRSNVPNKVIYQKQIDDLKTIKPPANFKTNCESFESRDESKVLNLTFEPSISINENLMIKAYDQIRDEKILSTFSSVNQILGHEIGWRDADYKWKAYLSKMEMNYIYPFVLNHIIAKYEEDKLAAIKDIENKIQDKMISLDQTLKKFGEANYMYKYWKEELESLNGNIDSVNSLIMNYEHHRKQSKNWIHLIGLYSEDKAGISFGGGKMQYFINLEDLKNMKFDNVYCDICN